MQYAHVNGVRLAYDRAGQGFPMLLIHGFPRDRRLWRKLVPLVTDRFDTVAMDRRGYGESDRPIDPAAYDNATMAQDALDLASQLHWERFVVVGHDLGQPVAQRMAADHPERIAAAVFLDGLPNGIRHQVRIRPGAAGISISFVSAASPNRSSARIRVCSSRSFWIATGT